MNIEAANPKITTSTVNQSTTTPSKTSGENSSNFSEELDAISKKEEVKDKDVTEEKEGVKEAEEIPEEASQNAAEETQTLESDNKIGDKSQDEKNDKKNNKKEDASSLKMDEFLNGLQNTVKEINKVKNPEPQTQTDEDMHNLPQNPLLNVDNNKKHEGNVLINNDMNVQEPKEPLMPQMNSGMNFDSNGQPFSDLMNNQKQPNLVLSQKDLEEEQAILSTMNENLAIARKNMMLNKTNEQSAAENPQDKAELSNENSEIMQKVKTVSNEQGVKRVDTKNNVTVETVVKYDNIIMDAADVDFFTKLVENGTVDMNTSVRHSAKSSQVSKTLADMLAKSMQDNQPVRIDFDNNISVIIKISKQGKISADFLPSSQVAEAYLKENLPLLKQRFDDNNIEYDELNQRQRRQEDDKDNRRKGRKDE